MILCLVRKFSSLSIATGHVCANIISIFDGLEINFFLLLPLQYTSTTYGPARILYFPSTLHRGVVVF